MFLHYWTLQLSFEARSDHRGIQAAGILWSVTSDFYGGFEHSSVLSKSIHTEAIHFALLQHHGLR